MGCREPIVTSVTIQFYEMTDEEAHVWRLGLSVLLDEIMTELKTENNAAIESPIEVEWPAPAYVACE